MTVRAPRLSPAPALVPWRLYRRYASRRNLLGVAPLIVYQMAKVGSSAIVAALRQARMPVFHVHRMDAAHLTALRETRRALGWDIPPTPPHDLLGLRLRRDVIEPGGPAAIVTLVRDPIARNLSSYFEHLDAIWRRPNAHEHVSMDQLIHGFSERFPHPEPLTWFEDELEKVTGFDVYQTLFPACGHLSLRLGNRSLLILKAELPDETKAEALTELTGTRIATVHRVNPTRIKPKGVVYRRFVESLRLSDAYLSTMLESRYCRHFYSPAERAAMWRRYAGG